MERAIRRVTGRRANSAASRLDGRHDLEDTAGHPDRRAGRKPAGAPPGERVRRGRGLVEAARSTPPLPSISSGRHERGPAPARVEALPSSRTASNCRRARPAGYTPSVLVLSQPCWNPGALRRRALDRRHQAENRKAQRAGPPGADREVLALATSTASRQPAFAERRRAMVAGFLALPPARPRTRRRVPGDPRRCAAPWTASSPHRPGLAPSAGQRKRRAGPPASSPHIDFHRGGPAYAWAYRDLPPNKDATAS
jgi:hypothetical protein